MIYILVMVLMALGGSGLHAQYSDAVSPRDGWDFKFKDFPIGAWYGPYAGDEEVQLYKEAGFNVIMTGRYMNNDNKDLSEEMVAGHLDLAHKYKMNAIFDPYSYNLWSDIPATTTPHPVSLEELEWIYKRFGDHPALVGFLLGDDQSSVTTQLIATTNYMRENCPHLMPWICQNLFNPSALVELGNPIADWQMYPTLYNRDLSAPDQMQIYCNQLDGLNKACERNDLIMWPMFNVVYVNSDNVIRFQIYSSLAYASQGIWYFHYKGGLRGNGTEVLNTYYPAAEANKRVAAWGPGLLGCETGGVFSTGWEIDNAMNPDSGKYVTEMSDDLLVGILLKDEEYPMAMVVDKRLSKEWQSISPREVIVNFSENIEKIYVLEGDSVVHTANGSEISLQLEAGGGQLLQLVDPVPNVLSAKPSTSGSGEVELNFNGYRPNAGYWIYYSIGGIDSPDSIYVESTNCIISNLVADNLYYFWIRAVSAEGISSAASKTAIATPGPASKKVLIVDGTTMEYLSRHGDILYTMGYGIASSNHKAIENNNIDLMDFGFVDWIVGNQDDDIFTDSIQGNIKNYLENGGNFLISGANIGFALSTNYVTSDKTFYREYLKSVYLYFAPDKIESKFYQIEAVPGTIFEGLPLLHFDDGTKGTYNVSSPDVIAEWKGSTEGLRFSGTNKTYRGACTYYSGQFGVSTKTGKLVYLSVPVETIYPDSARKDLMQRIYNFFNETTVIENFTDTGFLQEFHLSQNYPNPFNPQTTISFNLYQKEHVRLEIFSLLGQRIQTLVNKELPAGKHEITWQALNEKGKKLPSGIYIYQLTAGVEIKMKRMTLIR